MISGPSQRANARPCLKIGRNLRNVGFTPSRLLCIHCQVFAKLEEQSNGWTLDKDSSVWRDTTIRGRFSRAYIDIYRFDVEDGSHIISSGDGFDSRKYYPADVIFPLTGAQVGEPFGLACVRVFVVGRLVGV